MRNASEHDVIDTPRWSLWLVALLCFGPVTAIWLLGVFMVPLWVLMIGLQLAEPERFDPSDSIWHIALPIGCVIGGFIGLAGLVRVLRLPRHERPKSHRVFTLGMVAIGFAALVMFNMPFDFSDGIDVAMAVYLLLPLVGAAWLLFKSWKQLLAYPR